MNEKTKLYDAILVAISEYHQPKRILEFGNTDLFLNKSIFPLVSKVVRVTDEKIKNNDSRLECVEKAPVILYDYDLIFVDGPNNLDKKAKTICYIMRDTIAPIMIITGYDYRPFRDAINRAYDKYFFKPDVLIAYREKLPRAKFNRLQRRIDKYLNTVKDVNDWKPLLQ